VVECKDGAVVGDSGSSRVDETQYRLRSDHLRMSTQARSRASVGGSGMVSRSMSNVF
jgi:hypothetical protein